MGFGYRFYPSSNSYNGNDGRFFLNKSFDLVGQKAQEELEKLGLEIEAMMKRNAFQRLYSQVHGRIVVIERFKGFWVFAQEMWYDSVSGKLQCLQRLQIK